MRIGSLFTGTGMLDVATQAVFGGRIAWHVDNQAGPIGLLQHHYPNTPNHGDVTGIDWSTVEPVDILTGGSPCQDISHAGRKAGMTDGTRSNLWANMRQAIDQLQPRLVVWENVRGALNARAESASDMEPGDGPVGERRTDPNLRAAGRVCGDLAAIGYDARWGLIRASDVGAPHQRARVFLIAYPAGTDPRHYQRADRPATPRPTDPVLKLLPTPEAKLWKSGPDYARATRPGSGGDDLVTVAARATQGRGATWGDYQPAIDRWARITRPAPPPMDTNQHGRPRLSAAFAEWIMGCPAGWVTDPATGMNRAEQFRALGNGVVPQQAAAGLTALLDMSP